MGMIYEQRLIISREPQMSINRSQLQYGMGKNIQELFCSDRTAMDEVVQALLWFKTKYYQSETISKARSNCLLMFNEHHLQSSLIQFLNYLFHLYYLFETEMGNNIQVFNDEVYFDRPQKMIDDQKMKEIPHRLIGLIKMQSPSYKNLYGTGTLISPNLVLTVAHNIYNHKSELEDKMNKNFEFYLAQNGKIDKCYKVQSWYYNKLFQKENLPKYDVAIMKLEEITNEKRFFNLIEDVNKSEYFYVGENIKWPNYVFQEGIISTGKDILSLDRGLQQLAHRLSTNHGQSGAIIILMKNNQYYIMGVHKGGVQGEEYKVGVLFTKGLIDTLRQEASQLKAINFNTISTTGNDSLEKAEQYRQKEQWGRAEYWYLQFLSNGAVHFWANYNLAITLIQIGKKKVLERETKYKQALERINEACQISHDDLKALKLKAFILTLLGNLGDRQKYKQALNLYQNINKRQPENFQNLLNIATVLNYLEPEEGPKAIDFIQQIERIFEKKKTPELYNAEGYYYFKQGQLDEAKKKFSEAVELDHEHEQAHLNLGSVLQEQEEYEKAIIEFEEVLKINPMSASAQNNIGVCWNYLNDKRKAQENLLIAMRRNPLQQSTYANYLSITDQTERKEGLRDLRGRYGKLAKTAYQTLKKKVHGQ